ncbi:MAG: ATP-binding protein [Desulfobaccales bacterium]
MATKQELLEELAEVRARLEEAEDTLRAIHHGEVDALVISGPEGEKVYTLKGADHSYRILVETINEGAATLTPDGTIFYANRKLAQMLDLPLERLITSAIADYIAPADREWFEALLSRGKQGESQGEVRLRAADGALVPTYLSLSSLKIEGVPDTVCLALTDLTEQKRQEEILAEGRLSRAILEQAEHVIMVCNAKGTITQSSRAAHQLFAGNPLLRLFSEAFPISIITYGSTDDLPFAQAFSLVPVLEGQVYRDVEATFQRGDGRKYHLLLDAGPLYGENGVIQGCIVSLTDITERKRQEVERQRLLAEQQALTEELTATNEELQSQAEELTVQKEELERLNADLRVQQQLLEAANEEMEAFSSSVSHDLKVPVRAIDGFARMLKGDHADRLDTEGLRLLQVIRTNAKLMNVLIDDLLALSRLGRLQVRKSAVNLATISGQIFKQLREQVPNRDLQITIGDLPPALGDQSLLYQVMTNLLTNAVKFTKSRQTAAVEVGGLTKGKENIYYVKDNGIGFDEHYISNLFRPFQRLHNEEQYEGTGIGLAIVKRIVQRHGGRVWAEGKVGKGATFYFSLPKNGGVRSAN